MEANNCIKCEYIDIKHTIEELPIFDKRLVNVNCIKHNTKRAIYKVFDSKVGWFSTAKFIIKHNIDNKNLCLIYFIKTHSHKNLANVYEIGTVGNFYIILAKYIDGLTLDKFIRNTNDCLIIKHVIMGTLEGLKFLHSNNIQHTDIKPQNIIVTQDNVPKLIDFDLATQIKKKYVRKNVIMGTRSYIPKEILMEKKYYLKSDIWSLGVSIIKSLHKTNVVSEEDDTLTDDILKSYEYEEVSFEGIEIKLDNTLTDCVRDMVNTNVYDRPSAHQLLKRLKKT